MAEQSAWAPQAEPLRELAKYLNDTLSADRNAQRKAELMLKSAKASPDFNNYLAFLLSNQTPPPSVNLSREGYHAARSAAALMLKNEVKTSYQAMPSASKTYIRSSVMLGLRDPNAQMRNLSGTVVTDLVRQATFLGWPGVLQELISMAENADGRSTEETQEGAAAALFKVCEDHKTALNKEYQCQRPLNFLIPKLLELTSSPVTKVRSHAIGSMNVFILQKSDELMANLDAYLARLFGLANDTSDEVKKHICRAIIQIAEVAPQRIAPHLDGLVDYMITQQQRGEENLELALDAAEFWLSLSEDENMVGYLAPFLPKVVPTLLNSMIYSEEEVLRLEGDAEDAELEDREQDIKPQFASTKGARFGTANGNANGTGTGEDMSDTKTFGDGELDEGELDEYDEDGDDDDPEEQWNLRKCSAASLDVLASVFHEAVFDATLPFLKENLNHTYWPKREAAVLAIGAIADGCMDVVQPHLPDLIPFLLQLLQDPESVVRQISCWSLGRYSAWASHLPPAGKEQFFLPMMDGILKCMLDKNKRVQEAAASAFANLEEKAGKELGNPKYCEVIARQFAECFQRYKDRNMFILYDCVQTLAEHVGETLQNPELVHSLMPALIGRWEKVPDQSKEMFPLLECLSYVAQALGNTFSPYAGPLYSRCIKIIYQNLQDSHAAADNPSLDIPEKDFLVTSLDLISAILQALGEAKSVELVRANQPSMFELLLFCMEDPSNEVRQSAYALLGDCAIHVFPELQPSLPTLLPHIINQMDLSRSTLDAEQNDYAVANNACWSCGEIAMQYKQGMEPYAEDILQKVVAILINDHVNFNLHENAAIALGRVGVGSSGILAKHLATLAPLFLRVMKNVAWTEEKANAFKGFSEAVLRNPQGLEQCLLEFLSEIARSPLTYSTTAEDGPYEPFKKVVDLYKDHIPNFDVYLNHLPPEDQQMLRQNYMV